MHSLIKRGASLSRLMLSEAEKDGAASAMFHDTTVSGVEYDAIADMFMLDGIYLDVVRKIFHLSSPPPSKTQDS